MTTAYCACGKEFKRVYHHQCDECREISYLAKATWLDDAPDGDFMWCDSGDNYSDKDQPDEDAPYLFIAKPDMWEGLDIESALESSLDNYSCESVDHMTETLFDLDELKAYVKQWNAKQCVKTYFVPARNYKAVIFDKDHPTVRAAMKMRERINSGREEIPA